MIRNQFDSRELDFWVGHPSSYLVSGTLYFSSDHPSRFLALVSVPCSTPITEVLKVFRYHPIQEFRVLKTAHPKHYTVLLCMKDQEDARDLFQDKNGERFNMFEDHEIIFQFLKGFTLNDLNSPKETKRKKKTQAKKAEGDPVLSEEPIKREDEESKEPLKLNEPPLRALRMHPPEIIFDSGKNDSFLHSLLFFNKRAEPKPKPKKSKGKDKKDKKPLSEKEHVLVSEKMKEEEEDGNEIDCVICIEKLNDEPDIPVVSVMCGHSFHGPCLQSMREWICPLCRYSLSPQERVYCQECSASDVIWSCMTCGFLGCMEEPNKHMHEHFQKTCHVYSMDPETKMVFDHSKNQMAHRIILNQLDGKPVEFTTKEEETMERKLEAKGGAFSKLDSISQDYMDLINASLASQSIYFNQVMAKEKEKFLEVLLKINESIEEKKEKRLPEALKQLEKKKKELEEMRKESERLKREFAEVLGVERAERNELEKLQKNSKKKESEKEQKIKELKKELEDLKADEQDLKGHIGVMGKINKGGSGDAIRFALEAHMGSGTGQKKGGRK